MTTTEALLRRSLDAHGAGLTLDPAFGGLPGAAHGGTILALLDAIAGLPGTRTVSGRYLRRVPLGVRLDLEAGREDAAATYRLRDREVVLVEGRVAPGELDPSAPPAPSGLDPSAPPALDAAGATPLPVSSSCFVCGVENGIGLRARLAFDDQRVGGTWLPPARLRGAGGDLSPLAVTALLDEAAFWLGALASGESGMTTDLAVTLAGRVALDAPLRVSGERARVHPAAGDPRYWHTHAVAWDPAGRVVASADITFVAIRGAARKLSAWLDPLNPPGLLARIFPP